MSSPSPQSLPSYALDLEVVVLLDQLLDALTGMKLKRGGLSAALTGARAHCRALGVIPNPMGTGASKLGIGATYRPVGSTCPASCPLKGAGCYAQQGHVGLAQKRASSDLMRSLASAACMMVLSARYKQVCRLHVSGDFADSQSLPDVAYIQGVAYIARHIKAHVTGAPKILAYTYTHITRELFDPYSHLLLEAGVVVRQSDDVAPGGVVVEQFDKVEQLRVKHPESTFVKCRAQLDELTQCVDCKLCWEKPELVVVFKPHGSQARRVQTYLQAKP